MKIKSFKIKLLENDHTLTSLSKELNANRDTLSRWIHKGTYPLWAIIKTAQLLNLSHEDIMDVFISEEEDTSDKYII